MVAASGAEAAPFQFTFTGSVSFVDAGLSCVVSVGDLFSLSVIVDNGGTSTLSQVWAVTDTLSATVTAGGYAATCTADFFPAAGFATDAAGNLTSTQWFGTLESPTSADNPGTGARLFSDGLIASNGLFVERDAFPGSLSNWSGPVSASVAPIPLPASLMLLLGGMGVLAGATAARRSAA
jgi:hypothetical protein